MAVLFTTSFSSAFMPSKPWTSVWGSVLLDLSGSSPTYLCNLNRAVLANITTLRFLKIELTTTVLLLFVVFTATPAKMPIRLSHATPIQNIIQKTIPVVHVRSCAETVLLNIRLKGGRKRNRIIICYIPLCVTLFCRCYRRVSKLIWCKYMWNIMFYTYSTNVNKTTSLVELSR